MIEHNRIQLALDMYVLGQGIKTGVYRVCDELFPRLINNYAELFQFSHVIRKGFEEGINEYLSEKNLPRARVIPALDKEIDAEVLLLPFGVMPSQWEDKTALLHVHIIYDLIAIRHPEFFTPEAAQEVQSIIAGLGRDTVIFAISDYTKKDLIEYRPDLDPEQITVIPMGAGNQFVPCENSQVMENVRSKYGIPPGVPYVLSVATLEVRKNLDQVVRVFLSYLDRNPESQVRLVLSGMSGWKLEKLNETLAGAGRWQERVVVTGFVDNGDLSALYSGAMCFLYLSKYEGFGLPPLEAMSCGTPVICSNNSSLPEVVGDAGILVAEDNTGSIVDALTSLIDSPATRNDLSAKGILQAQKFNWDRCAEIVALTIQREYRKRGKSRNSIRGPRLASFFGYENGDVGPAFPATSFNGSLPPDLWPSWKDRLDDTKALTEGGLRLQGEYKTGRAGEPLISYVTVVRNNERTLERTILSVQNQSYRNVEHIIVDGASTDNTLAIIESYAKKIDYYVSEADKGLYDALNKAVQLCRGELICVLNSDDWLEVDAAKIAAKHFSRHGGIDMLLSGARVHDKNQILYWPPAFVHPGSYFTCANDCHNAIYASKRTYELSGPYDASFKIAADFKWIMTCLDAGIVFAYTDESTVNYSLGGASSDSTAHAIECMRIARERFPALNEKEVLGLFHSFFVFRDSTKPFILTKPSNYTEFLKRLFVHHATEPDFLRSLAWANITVLDHPYDNAWAKMLTDKSTIKDKIRQRLITYPFIYKSARMIYRRFLKGAENG